VYRPAVITLQRVPGYAPRVPTVSKREIAADGDDVALIAGLPVPCTIGIVGPMCTGAIVIDSGRIEFTAEEPGDYTIWLSAPGWLDWSVVITAAASPPWVL
jgi:hypothetical protein